jgi:hypothetical protein
MKKIIDYASCQSLLALVNMGKVRIVKEHTESGPLLIAVSASGNTIGAIGERYKYLFETVISERGSGDGLFEGCSQTTSLRG